MEETDLEREKQVILQEIKMVEDTPDDLIHDLFAQSLWPHHPLGRPILGRLDSLGENWEERAPLAHSRLLPPPALHHRRGWEPGARRPGAAPLQLLWRMVRTGLGPQYLFSAASILQVGGSKRTFPRSISASGWMPSLLPTKIAMPSTC